MLNVVQRIALFISFWIAAPLVQGAALQEYKAEKMGEDGLRLTFAFSEKISAPEQIWMENPTRLVMDFEGASSTLTKTMTLPENFILEEIDWIDSQDSVQVVLTFEQLGNYQVELQPDALVLELTPKRMPVEKPVVEHYIDSLMYHQEDDHVGRLSVGYSPEHLNVEYIDEKDNITIRFSDTTIDKELVREFNVAELETPVEMIEVFQEEKDVLMRLVFNQAATPVSYQTKSGFHIEVLPKRSQDTSINVDDFAGDLISLNFQEIETRAVLQLLADFSDFNVVTSDSVSGNITLRLKDVPWDQALELILKIKGLDKRQEGNVLLIAPTEELAEQERLLLESTQEIEDLSPLVSELIQINYAKAADLGSLLEKDDVSILSPRGKVTTDERTNTMLIYEVAPKLEEIKELLRTLDRPIRQVLIEARIVKANDNFEKAMGVKFGVTGRTRRGRESQYGVAGNLTGSNAQALGLSPKDVAVTDRLSVSLPRTLTDTTLGTGGLAFTLARLPGDTILDLELSALENEGLAEIVSSPRLVTANQKTAYIESGEEIPYNETTSSGAASVAFKKAVLRLEVTPQITPDNRIILDLLVNQDSRGKETSGGIAIDKQEMQTQALVDNGETIVLGGIYKQTTKKDVTKVPLLGDLPYLGKLFRNERRLDEREELLIFVTPKIVEGHVKEELKKPFHLLPPIGSVKEEK